MPRLFAVAVMCAVAACTQPSAPPAAAPETTTVAESAATPAASTVSVDAKALGGEWSFGRDCGLSDLVFTNTSVSYYDYADQSNVVSYSGTWAIEGGNHVALTLHRLDAHGAPTGEALSYNLDVTAPITTDLTGTFGQPGAMRDINAKRCANEDRE
ncbi:MAG: hypothetical protein QM759_01130 [Terricaulis sp.]